MAVNVCILVSTCERYRRLAAFTAAELLKHWRDLPPAFCSGLESALSPDCSALLLRDDPTDWMAVTHSACEDLLRLGFTHTYFILDDHPPLGPCHAGHLNQTIPAMAQELDAASISLSGYGQRRRRFGRHVHWRTFDLDLVPASELWKFPLHPALWDLEVLRGILEYLIKTLPSPEHTPWAFERKGGDPANALPEKWKSSSYRLNGAQMTARPLFALRHLPLRVAQILAEIFRMTFRAVAGKRGQDLATRLFRWLDCPYDGPYPLFWSGLMAKGKLNIHLAIYWAATFRGKLSSHIRSLIEPSPPN